MRSSLIIFLMLFLGLACGGGGGGEATATVPPGVFDSGEYLFIRASHVWPADLSVASGTRQDVTSDAGLSPAFSEGATLQVQARASETDPFPELLITLKKGNATTIPEDLMGVIYGQVGSDVIAILTRISHLASNPTSEVLGISNSISVNVIGQLPSTAAILTSDGLVSWSGWTGGIDKDSTMLILSKDNLMMVLCGVDAGRQLAALEGLSLSATALFLNKEDAPGMSVSGKGTGRFSNGKFAFVDAQFSQSNNSTGIPTVERNVRRNPELSQLIDISSLSDFSTITEQGFDTGVGPVVVINPDNPNRPALFLMSR